MNDNTAPSTYKSWFQKYSSEKALLIKDPSGLKKNKSEKWTSFETGKNTQQKKSPHEIVLEKEILQNL